MDMEAKATGAEGILEHVTKERDKAKAALERLESMYKDMKRSYKNLVASKEVLKELALLRDFYEEVTGKNSNYMTEEEMWKEVDEVYTELKDKIREMPEEEVKRKLKLIRRQKEEEMSRAVRAKQRAFQVEAMIRGIRKSYERPPGTAKRPVLPRSLPPAESPPPPTPPSTPGASYRQELEAERGLYQPVRHLRELREARRPSPEPAPQIPEKEQLRMAVHEEINKFAAASVVCPVPLDSSTESSGSSPEPIHEIVNEELEKLKTLVTFSDILALQENHEQQE